VPDRDMLTKGLTLLATIPGKQISKAMFGVYFTALEDVSNDAFSQAVISLMKTFVPSRQEWFPFPGTIRRAAAPYVDVDAEAVRAFEAVLKASDYDPVRGQVWTFQRVAMRVSFLAAESFTAAGHSRAFASEQGEGDLQFLRRRFVEAYKRAWEAKESGRALAVEEKHAIGQQAELLELTKGIGNGPARQLLPGAMRPVGTED